MYSNNYFMFFGRMIKKVKFVLTTLEKSFKSINRIFLIPANFMLTKESGEKLVKPSVTNARDHFRYSHLRQNSNFQVY